VCGNCGRGEKCVQGFGLESRGRKPAWKNLGVDGSVMQANPVVTTLVYTTPRI
jgi:hypothetical protein